MIEKVNITDESDIDQRLDVWLASRMPEYSRSALQKAIKAGDITVNDQTVKPKYPLQRNDEIRITMPEVTIDKPEIDYSQVSIPLIYHDEHILVIDKPAGISVHPAPGYTGPTISEWFAFKFPQHVGVGDLGRPGIVHRLDKDTSGVMVLARTDKAFKHLKSRFKNHTMHKEYLTLVFGEFNASDGRINQSLARSKRHPMRRTIVDKEDPSGKIAITEWRKEQNMNGYALIRVFPLTGRTHQIRVHMHYIGHPIVGDQLYTFKRKKLPFGVKRQMLHAETLTFTMMSGKRKTFKSPLPQDFADVISRLTPHSVS